MITDPEIREAFERGREAVAIGWEWARGQLAIEHYEHEHVNIVTLGLVTRVLDMPGHPEHGKPTGFDHGDGGYGVGPGIIVPDFRCPGTRGHLLDQVRKAWRWSVYVVCLGDDGWHVVCPKFGAGDGRPLIDDVEFWGATEVEALLAARKAARR